MFGDPSKAQWGSFEWGLVLPDLGNLFAVDAVIEGTEDVSFLVDGLVGLIDLDSIFGVDAIIQAEGELGFGVDFAPSKLNSSAFRSLEAQPYVLVELLLPGGPIRVSGSCVTALGAVWGARLVSGSDVLRAIGRGTDDFRVVLDDTDVDGQTRIRDLFSADDPESSDANVWLGAVGLDDGDHVVVFEGKIEQVTGFSQNTVTIQIVRREALEDKILGQLVSQNAFAFAPPESIGRMVPIVFGTVDTHEGIVVDTNAVSATSEFMGDELSSRLIVIDGSLFPLAGFARVEEEEVEYFSKLERSDGTTILFLLARGLSGTPIVEHNAGAVVEEIGPFSVKLASHPLGKIRNVKIQLPSGDLGDPVPQPVAISGTSATLDWDRLPRIRDPKSESVFIRIHFARVVGTNAAINPQFAARENPGYSAFGFAEVDDTLPLGGQLVLRLRPDSVGEPGDLQRAWIGVVLDPKSLNDTPGTATVNVGGANGLGFKLQPTDLVPQQIARRDEKTGDRTYQVPVPEIEIKDPPEQRIVIVPTTVIEPGLWVTDLRAARVVDSNIDSCAAFILSGVGEVAVVGLPDAIYSVPVGGGAVVPPGSKVKSAKLVFVAGWTQTPQSAPFNVFLRDENGKVVGASLLAESTNGQFTLGFIRGRERFEVPLDPLVVASVDEKTEWVVSPKIFGASVTGIWIGCELFIEAVIQQAPQEVEAKQEVRQTVTNYFEVTDLIPTIIDSNGEKRKDWDWFRDVLVGGTVQVVKTSSDPLVKPRILEIYYTVEHTPFVEAPSATPRVFADVSGLVPNGNPADVMRELVTRPLPEGLGLPATRIDAAAYQQARASLAADGIRSDFSIRSQVPAVQFLGKLAAQTDLRETWRRSVHRIVRRVLADVSSATKLILQDGDILRQPAIQVRRGSLQIVTNSFTTTFRIYGPSGKTSRVLLKEDASSVSDFGAQEATVELDLIADEPTADLVTTRRLERERRPRWIVEFNAPLYALDLLLGDPVGMAHRDFSFEVGEVTQLNMKIRRLKAIGVQVVVWKKD